MRFKVFWDLLHGFWTFEIGGYKNTFTLRHKLLSWLYPNRKSQKSATRVFLNSQLILHWLIQKLMTKITVFDPKSWDFEIFKITYMFLAKYHFTVMMYYVFKVV